MIVLDTHIWLWWVNDDQTMLKSDWRKRIDDEAEVGVSAMSCFEVAWLDRHERIVLPESRATWFEKALTGSGIVLLPVTESVASLAVDLPEHHRDPQDRIIIATALVLDSGLISADRKFSLYRELDGKLIS